MSKRAAMLGVAAVLMATPVLARDRFDVDYGRNDNRHYHSGGRNRGGAWIGNNRGHLGAPHGGHWGAGHGQFSPRGQGGYHWGW
jgi:hypothetical protein